MATDPQTIENGQLVQLPARADETERFNLMQREARLFSASPLIPAHLRQGGQEQAMANCYIALKLARTMGEDPLVVLQNIHIVSGKAGFSAQYMIARANAAGIFTGRIDWRIDRNDPKNLSVTAFATLRDTGQEVSVTCDMRMAEAEGWTKNPKYKSMPEVMLRYRSATFLVRFYAPDVMLGYQTSEEIEDVRYAGGPSLEAKPLTAAAIIEQSQIDVSPQPTEPREEERGAAESPTSAEPVAADNGGSLIDQAKAEIDAVTTSMDVNSRVSDWRKRLTDEEADELISYGMARVADLKAAANG